MIEKINVKLFYLINNLAGNYKILDIIGILSARYMPFVFILILVYFWFKKDKMLVWFSFYSVMLTLFINYLIAIVYFHQRPFVLGLGKLLISHAPDASFPSDHAGFLFSIALIFLHFKKSGVWGYVLFLLAILGSVARVYCGVHFPFDIIGSLLVAVFSSAIIYSLKNDLENIIQK